MSHPSPSLPCFERLEQRRLLATTLVADELVITGTEETDYIFVKLDPVRNMLIVNDTHSVSEYELATLSNVRIFTYGGDDHVYVDHRLTVSTIIDGGEGDDRLYGGGGKDLIFGGPGNDTIVGGDGNDALHGGDGDDAIYGNHGNDWLFGNAGSDRIFGGEGDDFLDGGEDIDVLRGDYGADQFAANSRPEELLDFDAHDTLSDGTQDESHGRPFKGFNSHGEWLESLKADAKDGGVRQGQVESGQA